MKTMLCLAVALLPLKADGLTELRTTLQKAKGTESVSAQVEVKKWSLSKDKGAVAQTGQALVNLEDGPQGLKVGWPQTQLERAETKRRKKGEAKKAKGGDTSSEALRSIGLDEAKRVLRTSEALLEELEGATLTSESLEPWEGKPARKLVVALNPEMDGEEKDAIKSASFVGTLWLSPEGLPYAMQRQVDVKGRMFLISFEMHEKSTRRYQNREHRLLLAEEDRSEGGGAMGKGGDSRTILKVNLAP